MDLAVLAAASGIVFLASAAKSLTGFAFALVLVPLLSLVWDPRSVVVASALLNGLVSLPLAVHARREIALRRVGLMLVGAVVGLPLGLSVLSSLDPQRLRVLIGALVILMGLLVFFGRVRPVGRERPALLAIGLLSGILNGGTSMGGPPVVLYLMSQGYSKEVTRATLLGFFGVLSVLTVAGFWSSGLAQPPTVLASLSTLPALALGGWAGTALFRWAPQRVFRILVLLVVEVSGALAVAAGLRVG
jgi:uncharacterized membrane protein YfcA